MHVKALPVQVIQGYIKQPLTSPVAVANANSHALSYLRHKNSDLHGNCAVIMHPLHLCVHAYVSVRVSQTCVAICTTVVVVYAVFCVVVMLLVVCVHVCRRRSN